MKQIHIFIFLLCTLLVTSCKDDEVPQEFSINMNEYHVNSKGGDFKASVISNYNWSASSDKEWIVVTSVNDKTGKDSYIKVSVETNTTLYQRSGNVLIQSKGLSHTIIVTQECNSEIVISEKEFKLSDSGENITINLRANNDCGVKTTEEWITEISSSGDKNGSVYSFSIAANETYDDRTGYIIFETRDLADTVTVWQCQKNGLILTNKNMTVHEDGKQISFEIKANVEYTYEISDEVEWISEVKTRALTSHSHTFTVAPNPDKKDRIAEIVFKGTSANLRDVLTITQAGQMAVLKVLHSNDVWDIPVFVGNNVSGEVDWGDGSEVNEYSSFLTHQYNSSENRYVTVSVRNVESVKMENIRNVSTIDLSKF